MDFEARYIDGEDRGDPATGVTAIWCTLNGRLRRFTADNVSDARNAGHAFYVVGAGQARHDVHVVRDASPTARLRCEFAGGGGNLLRDLPAWDPA